MRFLTLVSVMLDSVLCSYRVKVWVWIVHCDAERLRFVGCVSEVRGKSAGRRKGRRGR